MRPIEQQSILITGATDGLGLQVAHRLADRGATVLIHGRDQARCEQTVAQIERQGGTADYFVCDLGSLRSVAELAREVSQTREHLDVLVNNAATGGGKPGDSRSVSKDGHELVFAVNYLAPFLLTHSLLGLLRAAAPGRVVNVASVGQRPLDFDDLMLERSFEPFDAYCKSKLALIMFGFDLAERVDPQEVTVNSLHPASLMDTKMVSEMFGYARTQVSEGVGPTLRAICDPELEGVTGRYFDQYTDARALSQAYDRDARNSLWTITEQLIEAAV